MSFIKFYNCFMDLKGEVKLSPKEWYIYSLMAMRWSPVLNGADVTVSMINKIQNVYTNSEESANKKKILDMILKLESMKVINVKYEGSLDSKFKYDMTLTIEFVEFEGYEEISSNMLKHFQDPFQSYFLAMCKRFKQGLNMKFSVIGQYTELEERQAARKVHDMINSGIITFDPSLKSQSVDTGLYYATSNKYYIVDDVIAETKKETETDDNVQDDVDVKIDLTDESRKHNWYNLKEYIGKEDFIVLLTTKDKALIEYANKTRLPKIEKSGMGKSKMKEAREQAERELKTLETKNENVKIDEHNKSVVAESKYTMVELVGDDSAYYEVEDVEDVDLSRVSKIYYEEVKYVPSVDGYTVTGYSSLDVEDKIRKHLSGTDLKAAYDAILLQMSKNKKLNSEDIERIKEKIDSLLYGNDDVAYPPFNYKSKTVKEDNNITSFLDEEKEENYLTTLFE